MISVPNNDTFTLQNVKDSIYSHDTSVQTNLSSCFSKSLTKFFDPNYNKIEYAPVDSMKRFKNYTPYDTIVYGDLYNWYVNSPPSGKTFLPENWHIPSKAEWDTLAAAYPPSQYYEGSGNQQSYLNATSTWKTTSNWQSSGFPGTNTSGFSIEPSGCVFDTGGTFNKGGRNSFANFWTSSSRSSLVGTYVNIAYRNYAMYSALASYDKRCMFSLRLKETEDTGGSVGDTSTITYLGETYNIIRMADNCWWFAQNFRATKYVDGTPINYLVTIDEVVDTETAAMCSYEVIT